MHSPSAPPEYDFRRKVFSELSVIFMDSIGGMGSPFTYAQLDAYVAGGSITLRYNLYDQQVSEDIVTTIVDLSVNYDLNIMYQYVPIWVKEYAIIQKSLKDWLLLCMVD